MPTKVSWIGRLVDNMADVAKSGWGPTVRFALLVLVAGTLVVGAMALLRAEADEIVNIVRAGVSSSEIRLGTPAEPAAHTVLVVSPAP